MGGCSHLRLSVSPKLTLHAIIRHNEMAFSIREIDIKLLRRGSGSAAAGLGLIAASASSSKAVKGPSAASGQKASSAAASGANEQAARVKARQLMLGYSLHLSDATKEEIRWLKEMGVLGKRAPKSSLLAAAGLLQLLKDNQKYEMAGLIQVALDKFEAKRAAKLMRATGGASLNCANENAVPNQGTTISSDSDSDFVEGGDASDGGGAEGVGVSSASASDLSDDEGQDEDDEDADESYEEPSGHSRKKASPRVSAAAAASTGRPRAQSTGSKRKNSTSRKGSVTPRSRSRQHSTSSIAGGLGLNTASLNGIHSHLLTSLPASASNSGAQSPAKKRKGSDRDPNLSGSSPSMFGFGSELMMGGHSRSPSSSLSLGGMPSPGMNIMSPHVNNPRYSFSGTPQQQQPQLSSRLRSTLAGSREVDESNLAAASAALSSLPPELQARLMPLSHCIVQSNPKDCSPASRSQGHTSVPSLPIVRFGSDHSPGVQVSSDGLTVQGPRGGSGTIRASHGISSGVWYIEVRGAAPLIYPFASRSLTRTPSSPSSDHSSNGGGMDEFSNSGVGSLHYSPAYSSIATTSASASVAMATAAGIDQDQPHCRVGFATLASRLDFKLGQDSASWSFDDRYGDRIHRGEAKRYSERFSMGESSAGPASSPNDNGSTNSSHTSAHSSPRNHLFRRNGSGGFGGVGIVGGDVIGMLLELDVLNPPLLSTSSSSPVVSSLYPEQSTHRISFFKNNVCLGMAFENVPRGQTMYPAASVSNGMTIHFDFYVADRAAQIHQLQQQARYQQQQPQSSQPQYGDEAGGLMLPRTAQAAMMASLSPRSQRQQQQQLQHRVLLASNRNAHNSPSQQQQSAFGGSSPLQLLPSQHGINMMPPPSWPSAQSVLLPAASLLPNSRAVSSNAVIQPSQQAQFAHMPSQMASLPPRAMSAYQPSLHQQLQQQQHQGQHTQQPPLRQQQQQQLHQIYQQQQQQQQQQHQMFLSLGGSSRSPQSPEYALSGIKQEPTKSDFIKHEDMQQQAIKQEFVPMQQEHTTSTDLSIVADTLVDGLDVTGESIQTSQLRLQVLATQLEQIQSWPLEERSAKLELLQQQVQHHIATSSRALLSQTMRHRQQQHQERQQQQHKQLQQMEQQQREQQRQQLQQPKMGSKVDLTASQPWREGDALSSEELQQQIFDLQRRIEISVREQNALAARARANANASAVVGESLAGYPSNSPESRSSLLVPSSPPELRAAVPSFEYGSSTSSAGTSSSTASLAFSLRSSAPGEAPCSTGTAMFNPEPSPPVSPTPMPTSSSLMLQVPGSTGPPLSLPTSPLPSPMPMFGSSGESMSGQGQAGTDSLLGVSLIGSACSSPIPTLSNTGFPSTGNERVSGSWLSIGVGLSGNNADCGFLAASPVPLNSSSNNMMG